MVTIGISIAVPEPHGGHIRQARIGFGDAQAELIPTHITLLPPTDVDPSSLEAIDAHLAGAAAAAPRFTIVVQGTQTFRPVSPVVFLVVSEGGDRCTELAAAVRRGPLSRDLDFDYHPHITIAHHLDDPALDVAQTSMADYCFSFAADTFELFDQGDDGMWRPRRSYTLG